MQIEDPGLQRAGYETFRPTFTRDQLVPEDAVIATLNESPRLNAKSANPRDFYDNRYLERLRAERLRGQPLPGRSAPAPLPHDGARRLLGRWLLRRHHRRHPRMLPRSSTGTWCTADALGGLPLSPVDACDPLGTERPPLVSLVRIGNCGSVGSVRPPLLSPAGIGEMPGVRWIGSVRPPPVSPLGKDGVTTVGRGRLLPGSPKSIGGGVRVGVAISWPPDPQSRARRRHGSIGGSGSHTTPGRWQGLVVSVGVGVAGSGLPQPQSRGRSRQGSMGGSGSHTARRVAGRDSCSTSGWA